MKLWEDMKGTGKGQSAPEEKSPYVSI